MYAHWATTIYTPNPEALLHRFCGIHISRKTTPDWQVSYWSTRISSALEILAQCSTDDFGNGDAFSRCLLCCLEQQSRIEANRFDSLGGLTERGPPRAATISLKLIGFIAAFSFVG